MNIKYLLDSSAVIEYFKGSEKGREAAEIIENNECGMSIISIAELSDNFSRENRSMKESYDFILSKIVILDLSKKAALDSGSFKKERRKKIKDFGLVDAILYLTAKEKQLIFVTCDKDFIELENVKLL